jgi:LPPG:FO 2-phospho-L-lactate transferase
MIAALCGGVGGAKLALGLYRLLPPGELSVIVNTADDLDLWGLHISPDLDTVTYTLAGMARRDVGWGVEEDTFAALDMLRRYGVETWFQVGDRDLATDIVRTDALRRGERLTDITARIAAALDVTAGVLPMTDDPVATRLLVDGEWIHFQGYFVRRRHADPVEAVRYEGIEGARATDEVLDALEQAEVIVLVNSNPVLSILPILAVPGINDVLVTASAPKVAVSPIVGGDAVSGPAGDLMRLLEQPATAVGVARTYLGVVDGIVIDRQDEALAGAIRELGLGVLCTDIIMRGEEDRVRLAGEVLDFARTLT